MSVPWIAMTSTELTNLAVDLASDGFAGHEAAIRDVVRSARAHGVASVLVDILADPSQPEVARQRAFGTVAASLSFGRRTMLPATARTAA